jgi:hypothetical protein
MASLDPLLNRSVVFEQIHQRLNSIAEEGYTKHYLKFRGVGNLLVKYCEGNKKEFIHAGKTERELSEICDHSHLGI